MTDYREQLAAVFPETKRHYARCLRKLSYASHGDADRVRRKRQAMVTERLRIYGCPDCGLWHLTKAPIIAAEIEAEIVILARERRRYERQLTQLHAIGRRMMGRAWRRVPSETLRNGIELVRQERQWYLRCEDVYMAGYQREVALKRMLAKTVEEVRALDIESVRFAEERTAAVEASAELNRQVIRTLHEGWHREINEHYRLPCYPWRSVKP
jgi:hypothetical protein